MLFSTENYVYKRTLKDVGRFLPRHVRRSRHSILKQAHKAAEIQKFAPEHEHLSGYDEHEKLSSSTYELSNHHNTWLTNSGLTLVLSKTTSPTSIRNWHSQGKQSLEKGNRLFDVVHNLLFYLIWRFVLCQEKVLEEDESLERQWGWRSQETHSTLCSRTAFHRCFFSDTNHKFNPNLKLNSST